MVLTVRSSEAPPRHVHADFEEAFYVLEGEWEFEMDGKTSRGQEHSLCSFEERLTRFIL
ncbi:MAG: cupin domain-containing protein [Thermoplasmata archaeon]